MFHNPRTSALNMNPAQMMQIYNMVRPQDFDDDASVTSFVTLQSSTSNYLQYFYNKPFANGQNRKLKVKSRGIRKVLTPTKNKPKKAKDNNSKKSKKIKGGYQIHASPSFKNLSSLDKPSDDHTVSTFTNTTLGTDSCLNTARPENASETQLLPKITEVVTPQHVHKPTHADIDSDFSNGSGGTRISTASSTYSVNDLNDSKVKLFQRTEEYVLLGMTKHFVYNATIIAVVLMFVWQLSFDPTESETDSSSPSSEQAVTDAPYSSYQSLMMNLATALLLTRATVFPAVVQSPVVPTPVHVETSEDTPISILETEPSLEQQIQEVIDAGASEADFISESDNQLVVSSEVQSIETQDSQLYVRSLCDLQICSDEAYEYDATRSLLPFQLSAPVIGGMRGLLNRFSDLKFHAFGVRYSATQFRLPLHVTVARGFLVSLREKLQVPRLCDLDSYPSEADADSEIERSLVNAVSEKIAALKTVGDKARAIRDAVKSTLQVDQNDLQPFDY